LSALLLISWTIAGPRTHICATFDLLKDSGAHIRYRALLRFPRRVSGFDSALTATGAKGGRPVDARRGNPAMIP